MIESAKYEKISYHSRQFKSYCVKIKVYFCLIVQLRMGHISANPNPSLSVA